jgi:DNA repair exonuclease SbcCD ATPase subunit
MEALVNLKSQYQYINNNLHKKIGERDNLQLKQKTYTDRLTAIDQETHKLILTSQFLQTLSDVTRQQIIDRIGAIVTDALQKIKDPNLEFKMILSTERNQVDVSFIVVEKDTGNELDIIHSSGGTIADLITFPLKVSLLLKWSPQLSRILLLDEQFKFVAAPDREPLAEFIRQISEKLNLQILLVTHMPELTARAHKVFAVTKKGTKSTIEERPS